MTKMKKTIAIAISLCILVAGAATAAHLDPILPPVRVGNDGEWYGEFADCRLSTSIKETDTVVFLEIGNWLGESDDADHQQHFYDAKILKCYKGNLTGNIRLAQSGGSHFTYHSYPMYTYGNKFLVALKEFDESFIMTDGKEMNGNLYYIANPFYGLIRVEEDDSGNLYFMHYYCTSRSSVVCPIGDTSPLEFSVVDSEIRGQVNLNAKANDSFLPICRHIYKLSDFEEYLETVDWSDYENDKK